MAGEINGEEIDPGVFMEQGPSCREVPGTRQHL